MVREVRPCCKSASCVHSSFDELFNSMVLVTTVSLLEPSARVMLPRCTNPDIVWKSANCKSAPTPIDLKTWHTSWKSASSLPRLPVAFPDDERKYEYLLASASTRSLWRSAAATPVMSW
eukprot:scaffold1775_cov94-Phaeocystis_antarctica.AAC.3